jgi:muramoyltetrapeptide carboxypeptidase
MMITPPLLRSGDKIAIVAPSRKLLPEHLEKAIEILEGWRLEVILGKHVFSTTHSYLAGSDDERLHDLQAFVNDKSVAAIICGRGGYGSTRIVDALSFSALKKHPKWIIGFSDITAIHTRLMKEGLHSIHGIMPILFSKSDSVESVESIRKILFEGKCKIECAASRTNRNGSSVGQVVGGNLSLIVDSLGTKTEIDTNEKILLIEEIDEYNYKLDRMMTQLRRAGKLSNLNGLIVGHMTDIKDSDLEFGESFQEIVLNAVREFSYPVAFQFPSGHENPNLAWIHGGFATLNATTSKTSLEFQTSTIRNV